MFQRLGVQSWGFREGVVVGAVWVFGRVWFVGVCGCVWVCVGVAVFGVWVWVVGHGERIGKYIISKTRIDQLYSNRWSCAGRGDESH